MGQKVTNFDFKMDRLFTVEVEIDSPEHSDKIGKMRHFDTSIKVKSGVELEKGAFLGGWLDEGDIERGAINAHSDKNLCMEGCLGN